MVLWSKTACDTSYVWRVFDRREVLAHEGARFSRHLVQLMQTLRSNDVSVGAQRLRLSIRLGDFTRAALRQAAILQYHYTTCQAYAQAER